MYIYTISTSTCFLKYFLRRGKLNTWKVHQYQFRGVPKKLKSPLSYLTVRELIFARVKFREFRELTKVFSKNFP